MICEAPDSTSPAITCRPTPPHPMTQAVSPIRTRATLRTAPTPVTTAHPSSAACHIGNPSGIGTADAASITQRSAKHATISPCCSVSPAGSCSREVPSISVPRAMFTATISQRVVRPARHCGQRPHDGTKQNATRSPGATWVTPGATASTKPAPSCPSTIGQRPAPSTPSARWTSEWQTPAAATRTWTSPARGGSSRIVSISTGRPGWRSTAARTAIESVDTVSLERVEIGDDAQARPGRRRDRAVRADLDRGGQQEVATRGRPGRRVVRHLDERQRREAERTVQVDQEAVAVRPRVRRPRARRAARRAPRCAGTRRSRLPARRRAGRRRPLRAPDRGPRTSGAPSRLPRSGGRCACEGPGSRRDRSSEAAPPASTPRAARAPARTGQPWRHPSEAEGRPASASPGWRRPSARSPARRHRAPPRRRRHRGASRCGGSGSCRPAPLRRGARRTGGRAPPGSRARRSRRTRGSARCARRAAGGRADRAPARADPRQRPRRSRCARRESRPSRRPGARPPRDGRRRPSDDARALPGRAGGRRSRSPRDPPRSARSRASHAVAVAARDPTKGRTADRGRSRSGASRSRRCEGQSPE